MSQQELDHNGNNVTEVKVEERPRRNDDEWKVWVKRSKKSKS